MRNKFVKAQKEQTRNFGKIGFKKNNIKNDSDVESIKIIPLGGLERIGLNIIAFQYKDDIIVVDCGLGFPEGDMLGIDLCIPDTKFLEENLNKIKGIMITHGHEDHIGALPYILPKINKPIYATGLTMALIDKKLEEHKLSSIVKQKIVTCGQTINLGDFHIEFIKTNHSIQDACALAISTPAGTIIHTGDFKVDYTPVYGEAINLRRFAEYGKKGVLAMMSDSTNAEKPGSTISEKHVGKVMKDIFDDNRNRRIIIATFASNVDRVQQIIDIASDYNRKVVVEGRSMNSIIDIATSIGYLQIPKNIVISSNEISNYNPEQLCVICTGSQGETMAALSRIASGSHKYIKINVNDTIVFSSHPIPGNEKAVSNIINDLYALNAKVIFHDVHVSGHACREDLKLIYTLVQPKYAIPIHGELRHRKANANIAAELGIPNENIFVLGTGDVLALSEDSAKVIDKVDTGVVFVDGLGVGDVGSIVMRDRRKLSEDGVIIVVLAIDSSGKTILAGPDIVSRGFVYVRESEDLIENAKSLLLEALEIKMSKEDVDWNALKNICKDVLGKYVWENTKRKPMILPIIQEV